MKKLVLRAIQMCICAAAVAFASTAQARVCGVTSTSSSGTATYDPFSSSGLTTTSLTLTLTRDNPSGGNRTDVVNFYLKGQDARSDNITISATSFTGSVNMTGLNQNVFFNFASAGPTISPIGQTAVGNHFLKISFTGNNAGSDTVNVTFDVTLPAGLDLTASQSLGFDVYYSCVDKSNNAETGTISNAAVFPISVKSGLQAYFTGQATSLGIDFGDVLNKTTVAVTGDPATYNKAGIINVRSSGPYSVSLHSQNNYRLTSSGGSPITPAQTLTYKVKFLGTLQSGVSGGPATQTDISQASCIRAGLVSNGVQLPLAVGLTEGASGASPAKLTSTYTDQLTITVTPLAAAPVGTTNCASLSGTFP